MRFPVTARQQHIVRLNPASAPSLPRRDWFVLLPTVPSQHQKLSCSHLITRRGPMPRFHCARDCHDQYVGEMCGNPGFVPSARAKGIRNCRRRASGKRLKESTIFQPYLGGRVHRFGENPFSVACGDPLRWRRRPKPGPKRLHICGIRDRPN